MPNANTKLKRKPELSYVTYVFEIGKWQPRYSFSLNFGAKHFPGPYWEHASLDIRGEFVHPAKLKTKSGRLNIIADRKEQDLLEHPPESKTLPLCVGSFSQHDDYLEYLGSAPADAFWGLVNALGVGVIRYAVFHGEAIKWRKALIQSISFLREIDMEEFV